MTTKAEKKMNLERPKEWSPAFLACLGAWKEPIPRPSSRGNGKRSKQRGTEAP